MSQPVSGDVEETRRFLTVLLRDVPDLFETVSQTRPGGRFGRRTTRSGGDIDALVADIQGAVAEGQDAYLSAAAQWRIPTRRGTAADAGALIGFWLDIDRKGPGHEADQDLLFDEEELETFLALFPFPPTITIDSGGGWQLWWMLEEPFLIDSPEPRREAKRMVEDWHRHFSALAMSMDRKIDKVSDLARVLRPPGTFNFKVQPPRPVHLLEFDADRRYPLEDLLGLIEPGGPASVDAPASSKDPPEGFVFGDPTDDRVGSRFNRWVRDEVGIVEWVQDERFGYHSPRSPRLASLGDGTEVKAVDLTRRTKDANKGHSITVFPESGYVWLFSLGDAPSSVDTWRSYDPLGLLTAWVHGGDFASAIKAILAEHPDWATADSEIRFTDTANAERLHLLHGESIRWINTWSSWMVWDGSRWVIDHQGVMVHELAKDISRSYFKLLAEKDFTGDRKEWSKWANQSANRHRIDGAVWLARGMKGIVIDHEQLDADPWLLNVINGYIDLHDGSHHPPDRSKLMTMRANVVYQPSAWAPLWDRCLTQWFPDPEVRAYFQRLCGAAIVGEVRDHILVFAFGTGANGKGTVFLVLGRILGDYFEVPHKSLLVESRFEQHPTAIASLFRKRLVVAAETDRRVPLSEALVKNLTGGDPLTARRMRENFWQFIPNHTLFLQTNFLPAVTIDPAMWRRIRVLPFEARFEGDNQDKELAGKLLAEAPGILNWLIEGALAWQEIGIGDATLPASVLEATAAYESSEDLVSRWLKECGWKIVDPRTGGRTMASVLVESWAEWVLAVTGEPRRFNEVARALENRGCEKATTRQIVNNRRQQITYWEGIVELRH